MTRWIVLALALSCFTPCAALAQAPTASPRHAQAADHERVQLSLDPELASIDAESQTATGLYAAALTLHLGGIAVGVIGSAAGFCIFSCSDAQHTARDWGIAGFIAAGVGLLMFIPAIIVDVDSGHRRARHAEQGHVAFSIGAGGIGLEGSF
jgi:hypothetical protein